GVLDAVSKNIATNMSEAEIKALVKYQLTQGNKITFGSQQLTGFGRLTTNSYSTSEEIAVLDPDEDVSEAARIRIQEVMY
ncbi:MAG: hypothetical protein ACRCTA_06715, partial [Bacilli bacterium]